MKFVLCAIVSIALCATSVHSRDMTLQAHPLLMLVTGASQDIPFQVPVTFEFGDVPGRSYVFQLTFAKGKQACETEEGVEPPKIDATGIKGILARRMYWNGKMHEGLYLAPALMFTKSWGHRDEQVVGNFLFYEQDISETIFGALGYVGYAWTPGNAKITWDIGVGYRYVSSVGTQDIEESGIFPDLNLGVGFVF